MKKEFIITAVLISFVFSGTAYGLYIPPVGGGCAIETNRSSPCYGGCKDRCQTTKPTTPTTQTTPTTPQQPVQPQTPIDQDPDQDGQSPINPQYQPTSQSQTSNPSGSSGLQPTQGEDPASVSYPSGTKQGTTKVSSLKSAGKKTPVYSYRKIPTVKGKLLRPSQTRK